MIRHVAAALALASLFACAAPPKEKGAFLAWAKENFNHQDFSIPDASLDTIKHRLVEFTGRCLNVDIVSSGQGTFGQHWKPYFDQEPGKLSLFLAYSIDGTLNESNDVNVFAAQIWKGNHNDVLGVTYYRTGLGLTTEDVSKRLIPWLRNEKKLCPNLMK